MKVWKYRCFFPDFPSFFFYVYLLSYYTSWEVIIDVPDRTYNRELCLPVTTRDIPRKYMFKGGGGERGGGGGYCKITFPPQKLPLTIRILDLRTRWQFRKMMEYRSTFSFFICRLPGSSHKVSVAQSASALDC